MATRSMIGIEDADGTVLTVYCHNDGYLDGVGATLLGHYRTEAKVRELLALGDLSSLGDDTSEDATLSYHRSFGEDVEPWEDVKPKSLASVAAFLRAHKDYDAEYQYLFRPARGGWEYRKCYGSGYTLSPLTTAVVNDEEDE